MVNLQHSSLICILKGTLEVFSDLFLTKLLFHAVYNGHNSLYISVKDVALLQALKRDLTLLCAFSHAPAIFGEDSQALGSDIVHDGGGPLVGRDISGSRLSTLNII